MLADVSLQMNLVDLVFKAAFPGCLTFHQSLLTCSIYSHSVAFCLIEHYSTRIFWRTWWCLRWIKRRTWCLDLQREHHCHQIHWGIPQVSGTTVSSRCTGYGEGNISILSLLIFRLFHPHVKQPTGTQILNVLFSSYWLKC